MKKVLVFGSFDILHKGHEYFLTEAKKRGDYLVVTLGRDATITRLKKKNPANNEQTRIENLKAAGIADKIILGSLDNPYTCLDEKPDVICLGYDQKFFIGGLDRELRKRNLKTEIVRLSAYFPEKYKSSLLKSP